VSQYPAKKGATVRWLQRDETTFYMEDMELRERWQYYISSYMRVEPTEGVARARLQKSVLSRNLPASSDADSDSGDARKPLSYNEGLILRICVNSSKIVYEPDTSEYFIYSSGAASEEERARRLEMGQRASQKRREQFEEKMVMNLPWMKDLSREEVQKKTDDCNVWLKGDVAAQPATVAAAAAEPDKMDTSAE